MLEDGEMELHGNRGDTISVVAAKGDAVGVTLLDLEYPLDRYYMKYSKPIGISNVMLKDTCRIIVEKGCLLVIRNK